MQARLARWRVPIGVATAAVAGGCGGGGCVSRMLLRPKPEPNRSDEASRARLAVSRQAPKVVRVAYRRRSVSCAAHGSPARAWPDPRLA